MQIDIISSGKIKKNSEFGILISNYLKRITTFKINIIEIEDKNLNQQQINSKLFMAIRPQSFVIMLDESGTNFSTSELNSLQKTIFTNYKTITFLIGGADGFLPVYKEQAKQLVSFGKITLPHILVRLILVEQIYRIQTLSMNHPYHRE
ncbi:Ribosomal RNA large subunit methyltransferase H [Candidatus Hepatincola sp. Av]